MSIFLERETTVIKYQILRVHIVIKIVKLIFIWKYGGMVFIYQIFRGVMIAEGNRKLAQIHIKKQFERKIAY